MSESAKAGGELNAIAGEPLAGLDRTLPEQPLVTIVPGRSWAAPDWRELWAYRELLVFLTRRDVKLRYRQTAIGAAWAVIQPVFTMILLSLFFGRLAGMPSDGAPYPLFALAGLLPWTFFANAVIASGNSLVGNTNLVTKIYFPRIIIPAAAVIAGLVDLAVGFVVLAGLMAYYGVGPGPRLILLPLLVATLVLLAISVGLWLAALNVKYRDVRHAMPFLIQLWMFATPIIYPASVVPPEWRWLLALNPLTGLVEGVRASVLATPLSGTALLCSVLITAAAAVFATYSFKRMERSFADVI